MKLLLSFSNKLTRYLQLDLPRQGSTKAKDIGKQTLNSDADTFAWQCHLVENGGATSSRSIVAVEAHSRYCIIIPITLQLEQEDLIQQLNYRWSTEMAMFILDDPEAPIDDIEELADALLEVVTDVEIIKNTDLSISGHITDIKSWIQDYCQQHELQMLNDRHSVNLAMHLNELQKTAKDQAGSKQRFVPLPRFVDMGLVMLEDESETEAPEHQPTQPAQTATVINLADYRRKVGL